MFVRFGYTSFGGSVSDDLREVEVNVDSSCGNFGSNYNANVMLCAGVNAGKKSICEKI